MNKLNIGYLSEVLNETVIPEKNSVYDVREQLEDIRDN